MGMIDNMHFQVKRSSSAAGLFNAESIYGFRVGTYVHTYRSANYGLWAIYVLVRYCG